MRHAAKVDENQPGIVKSLRCIPGCHVQIIGQPYDLLVGFRGHWFVLEVKDPAKPYSKQDLTPAQIETISKIRGAAPVHVVRTAEEAMCCIGAKQWPEVA